VFVCRDAKFATVRAARIAQTSTRSDALIVVAPAVEIAGQVVDERGEPLAEVEIRFDLPVTALTELRVPLDATADPSARATSDETGAFRFARLPAHRSASLVFARAGLAETWIPLPESSRDDLRVVMKLASEVGATIFGDVSLSDGAPARGATVGFGPYSTATDELGRFELPFDRVFERLPLYASSPGYQACLFHDVAARAGGDARSIGPVHLVLGERERFIAGRVVDPSGHPLAGWSVGVRDGTELFPGRMPPLFA
jgi:hypothetical protein